VTALSERERAQIAVKGSPTRCPYCHDDCRPGEGEVACRACLARHHADCWKEHGACGSCQGTQALEAKVEKLDLARARKILVDAGCAPAEVDAVLAVSRAPSRVAGVGAAFLRKLLFPLIFSGLAFLGSYELARQSDDPLPFTLGLVFVATVANGAVSKSYLWALLTPIVIFVAMIVLLGPPPSGNGAVIGLIAIVVTGALATAIARGNDAEPTQEG